MRRLPDALGVGGSRWDEGAKNLNDWWGCTLSTSEHEDFPNLPKQSLIRVKLVENGLNGYIEASLKHSHNRKRLCCAGITWSFTADAWGKERDFRGLTLRTAPAGVRTRRAPHKLRAVSRSVEEPVFTLPPPISLQIAPDIARQAKESHRAEPVQEHDRRPAAR